MEPLNFYMTPAIRYLITMLTDTESQEVDLSPVVPWVIVKWPGKLIAVWRQFNHTTSFDLNMICTSTRTALIALTNTYGIGP